MPIGVIRFATAYVTKLSCKEGEIAESIIKKTQIQRMTLLDFHLYEILNFSVDFHEDLAFMVK